MERRVLVAAILFLVAGPAVFGQFGSSGTSNGNSGTRQTTPIYTLTVNSNVRGAAVFVNNVLQDIRTPASIRLRPGTYNIRVEQRGYQIFQQTVTVTRNQTLFARLDPPYATVVLQVPADLLNNEVRDPWRMIDFYVDGRLRSEAQVQVGAGYHRIAIVSGGLRFEDEFLFEAGRNYTLEVILRGALYSSN